MKFTLICTDADTWGFGIRTISSSLRAAGHSSRLIFLASDSRQYSPETLAQTRELASSADVVGISCFSRGAHRAEQVSAYLRSSGKLIVWGGLHATLNAGECAAAADIVCRGEGEEAIAELAEVLEAGGEWRGLRNLAYMKGGQLVLNPVRPPIANLDDLPLLDFGREDEYRLRHNHLIQSGKRAESLRKAQALCIGSRGCPFQCTYCCNRQLKELYLGKGKYIRKMTPAKYVAQIEALHQEQFQNATDFFLLDEDFFIRSLDEIREFAALYRERIGIPFECMASPPRITEEKLELLADAGMWRIRMGIESGSERTKRLVYDRAISNEVVLQASRRIAAHKSVVAAYFFINGNPYEEQKDLLDTLQLMSQLTYPYYAQIFNLVFFPGSALYSKAVTDGVISGVKDSGVEVDYRGGFRYNAHSWKRKNVYLNVLVYLTEGKATRHRLGMLPRRFLSTLTRPGVIRFIEARPAISQVLAAFKTGLLFLRKRAGAVLKLWMGDPAGVYDVRRYFKTLTKKTLARSAAVEDRP